MSSLPKEEALANLLVLVEGWEQKLQNDVGKMPSFWVTKIITDAKIETLQVVAGWIKQQGTN